jgi:hypothetical protein
MSPEVLQAKKIILQELKYLSRFYPYNIKKFFDLRMLHAANITVFLDNNAQLPENFSYKLTNLIAGIELLATGVNLHSFNADDFVMLAEDIKLKTGKSYNLNVYRSGSDKNYTVDLLYGDIFYSRAVIYLLEYGDYYIFDSILESLKSVHKNRLLLHQKLTETVNNIKNQLKLIDFETRIEELLEENDLLILGVNSLLKTSFLTGWGFFGDTEASFPYEIINDFLYIKAYRDLSGFFTSLPADYYFLKKIKFIGSKEDAIKTRLDKNISYVKPEWLKVNLKSLSRLYF